MQNASKEAKTAKFQLDKYCEFLVLYYGNSYSDFRKLIMNKSLDFGTTI